MEYERIHKVQAGVLSPTKLRMKLLGAHNRVRTISNNSSRASPSKRMDAAQAQNRLLVCDVLEEVSDSSDGSKCPAANNTAEALGKDLVVDSKKVLNMCKSSTQQPVPSSSSMIHPVRNAEDDGNDCDSGLDNASTSSFEFHGGERTTPQNVHFSRQTSSKWNDAEKWIVNRQSAQQYASKGAAQNQGGHQMNANATRGVIVPKTSNNNAFTRPVPSMKRVNPSSSASRSILERLAFASHQPKLVRHADVCPISSNAGSMPKYQIEATTHKDSSIATKPSDATKAIPVVQSVSVRDVGTEMTPIPSQEPSRTGTPLGSMTPTRSPNCSIPSTPVGGRSASPGEASMDGGPYFNRKGGTNELSENEMRLKTRKEIAALGVQLGKMNIATWASKEELELVCTSPRKVDLERMTKEYAARAAAYEEAENSKHTARFKKEEVKIEAWESRQRAKLEFEMRKVEEHAERIRSEAMAKMAEKIEITRRLAEEKRASASARMNQQAARTVQKAEQIRQIGRVPRSHILCCSGCFCEP